jgi:hypothetical protein
LTCVDGGSIVAPRFHRVRKLKLFRRFSIPLFLLFYFASSFAATHYRALEASHRVVHAASSSAVEFSNSEESSRDAYPRFREAKKKAGIDLDFRLPHSFDLSPRVITREFGIVALLWETRHTVRALRDRGPPVHI